MQVYLRIENPLRLRDVGDYDSSGEVANEVELAHPCLLGLWERVIAAVDGAPESLSVEEAERIGFEIIEEALALNGYDGIVYENWEEGPGDSYIAFGPTQVKAALGNDSFDPDNPDIMA